MPPSRRDRRALIWGGAAIALLILYLLMRGGDSAPSPVELVQPGAQFAPPTVAAPPPPLAVPPAADLSQLRLFGVLGSGAVIGMADGSQRFVAVGLEVVPGVALRRIEVHHALLATAAGEVRLGFDGIAQAQAQAQAQAGPVAAADATQREETLRYRLALAPRQMGGRVSGYVVRPGASLLALEQAGIRPGDLILSVNGSELDAERLEGLSWQIANSTQVEFEVERGGRRMRLTLPGRRQ
jgi:general secretion pathway protein C